MTQRRWRNPGRSLPRAIRVTGLVCLTSLFACGTGGEQTRAGPADDVTGSPEAQLLVESLQAQFKLPSSDPDSDERVTVLARSDAKRFVRRGAQIVPRLGEGAGAGVLHLASVTLPAQSSGAMEVVDQTSKLSIRVSFEDSADVAAEAVDGYLVYRNALQRSGGSDVVQRVTPEGVEDYVYLGAASEQASVDYRVVLADGVAGLRLVSNTLEFLDEHGVPRLRVSPPYLVDAAGLRHGAKIEVLGCAVDTNPAPPMDRPTTDPGGGVCDVRIGWDSETSVAYPVLLDPGWVATGSMVVGRNSSGSVRLADGKILAAGGQGAGANDTSEVFDPVTKTWSASGTLQAGRSSFPPMALYGTTAIIVGGDVPPMGAPYTTEEWSNGVWSQKRNMEVVQTTGRALSEYGTSAVLVGGYQGAPGYANLASAAKYSTTSHNWVPIAPMNTPRVSARATVLLDGRLLVTGGGNGTQLDTAEVYNGSTWTLLSSHMSMPRANHIAERLPDGRVIVAMGGIAGPRVDIFDPTTDTFTPTLDYPGGNMTGLRGLVLPNRRFAIVGGSSNAPTYAFLPGEDAGWVNIANVIKPRMYPIAFPLSSGGHALFAGGSDPSEVLTLWSNGAAKTTGQPCASGYSSDNVCCDTACSGACDSCAGGTCTRITGAGSPSCSPFRCMGATSDCPATCSSDSACVSTYYCGSNTCKPKKANGLACTGNNQCTSAHCVDSVCCNTACNGACDVCNATPGTCSLLADGTQVVSCSPYLCSGAAAACPTSCVTTADCFATFACVGGKCQTQGQGTSCSNGTDCGGSFPFCVDGVCCDTACSGGCDRCDVGGLEGLCSIEPAGTPPTGCGAGSPYLCAGSSGACPTSCASDGNCISGYYCAGAVCLPLKSLGTGCTAGNECQSDMCVDSVCCDAACGGACDICNKSGSVGNCTAAGAGTSGEPSCAPFKCGVGATCMTSCAIDADCTLGFFCSVSGSCEAQVGLGAPCSTAAECTGGLVCADQVCCNSDCTGSCKSCLAVKKGEGVDGVCGPIVAGSDPDSECAEAQPETCGLTGQCDGSGSCEKYPVGTLCGSGTTCSQGNETRFQCNGLGSCDPYETVACAPYVCLGATCAASCTDDTTCSMTTYCALSTQTCVPRLGIGSVCAAGSECSSGVCADGVCCDKACTGQCYACSAAAKGHGDDGICEPIGAGQVDMDQPCPQEAVSTCGRNGACNGSGACAYYAPGTACKGSSTCVGGSAVGYVCDAFNECLLATAGIDCSPYLCQDGTGCLSSCAVDADCIAEHFCDAGQCQPKRTPGESCSKDAGCKSGTCVDGVCCTSACDGSCELCNLPNAQDVVDGVCRVVPANTEPAGDHAPCGGQPGDVCAGICNGSSPACVYPDSATSCPGASCTGNVAIPRACDSLGSCIDQAGVDCAAYACDSATGACKNVCLSNTDCAAGAVCNQASGVCATITNTCIDEFTSQSSDGKKSSCAPYKCSGGVCAQACTTSADCATGFVCQGSKCVEQSGNAPDSGAGASAGSPSSANADASGDSGGCTVAGSSRPAPSWFVGLAAFALFELLRRRRSGRPSSDR